MRSWTSPDVPSLDSYGAAPALHLHDSARGSVEVSSPEGPARLYVCGITPYDATHLALNYANGVPECYGAAGTPRVEESADAVVVTIPRTPVRVDGKRACIDIAMLGTVDITLDSPLAGRPVLDGARDGARVAEAAAPNDPDQTS